METAVQHRARRPRPKVVTLTAPGCPVAGDMPGWVQDAVSAIPEVTSCTVNLVFDPPWDPSLMSDEAKLELNMF